jgi:hypothetical protein
MKRIEEKWVEVIEPQVNSKLECTEPLEKRIKAGNKLVFVINDGNNLRRNTITESVLLSGKEVDLPFSSFSIYDTETEEMLILVTDEEIDSVISHGCSYDKKSLHILGFTLRPLIIPRKVVQPDNFFDLHYPWNTSSYYADNSEKFHEWSSTRKNLRIEFEMPFEWSGETRLYVTIKQTTEILG